MGLGDAVSQILAKDVAAPDPVLAKRKTALMKELEVDPVSYTHLTLPTTPYV